MLSTHPKTGYLNQDFQLFHLKDQLDKEFAFHYHDFHKIIIFLSGKVTYFIEGKAYSLKPWDILLVNHYDIHRPVIDPFVPYERIILWVNTDFIRSYDNDVCDISACFQKANDRRFNLVRLNPVLLEQLKSLLSQLEESMNSQEFGSSLLSSALFLQFMVYLNRIFLGKQYLRDQKSVKFDPKIQELLTYINLNLKGNLSADALASRFYLSKYHLMHKFKEETGYTLHQYITNKRLLLARTWIQQGLPVTKAALQCGFRDYTTFSRAYKKAFGSPPTRSARHPSNE